MQEIIISQDEQENRIIALVENGKLVEKYEEKKDQKRLEGNIYLGKVENVLIGMQAAFIDIGAKKNTFIHIKDIIPKMSNQTGNKNETLSKYNIKSYVKTGMPTLIQVKRDSTNKKGARVSTHISLPGRFVVLMPGTEFITISKKIEKELEKMRLLNLVKQNLPKGYGIIVRTSAQSKSEELIIQDMKKLIQTYENILKQAKTIEEQKGPFQPTLLYENKGMTEKILTDIMDQELVRIITNHENVYKEVKQFLKDTGLENKINLELKEKQNVLEIYDIQTQLEKQIIVKYG